MAARLNPGAVVAQWVPFHIVPPSAAGSIAAAFSAVFPDVLLWIDPRDRTGILLGRQAGSNEPLGRHWPDVGAAGAVGAGARSSARDHPGVGAAGGCGSGSLCAPGCARRRRQSVAGLRRSAHAAFPPGRPHGPVQPGIGGEGAQHAKRVAPRGRSAGTPALAIDPIDARRLEGANSRISTSSRLRMGLWTMTVSDRMSGARCGGAGHVPPKTAMLAT